MYTIWTPHAPLIHLSYTPLTPLMNLPWNVVPLYPCATQAPRSYVDIINHPHLIHCCSVRPSSSNHYSDTHYSDTHYSDTHYGDTHYEKPYKISYEKPYRRSGYI